MIVVTAAVLLVGSESFSLPLTVAEFVTCPADEGTTTIVTIALLSTSRLPRLQITGPLPLQLPCVAVAETNETPAGSVSVTVTFVAGFGP